jgi:hypothetical protein
MIENLDEMGSTALADRLRLIENMIAEGRQTTESWGWTFVLWGVAYLAAIIASNVGAPFADWSTFGHRPGAWGVCMISASVIMGIIIAIGVRRSSQPETTMGRAISALWIVMGVSMVLLLSVLGASGHLDQHIFVAIICALLGMTNAASSLILKWRLQFLCALVWWTSAVLSSFGSLNQSMTVFLTAIFLCQIVFGIFGMISESRERKARRSGVLHA